MKAQLELFNYQSNIRCTCAHPGGKTHRGGVTSPPSETPDDRKPKADLIRIVSHLEEVKFGSLCQHFYCSPDEGSAIEQESRSLGFPDAEVHLTSVEDTGNGFSGHFFNQFVHVSLPFCSGDWLEDYCEGHLHTALLNFRDRPGLLETVDGMRTYNFYRNGFGPPQERMPEDYFFITNVCHDIFRHNDECPAHFSRLARPLFRRVLGIPEEYCPSFYVITPETMLDSAIHLEIRDFLIDLLNAPSSYYLVAREGRISVVPTAEHGIVFASASDAVWEPSSILGATVTESLAPLGRVSSLALSDFELLLNTDGTKEADLQHFLQTHPEFLFAMDQRYCEIRPHVCLYDANGERLVPDFMARVHGSNIWDVIELKLPSAQATVRRGDVEKASATAARGIAELLRYRDYFGVRENRRRVTRQYGISAYEPCLVLLIGRGHKAERFEWCGNRAGLRNVEIVSYDHLFERAKGMRSEIDKLRQTPSPS